MYTDYYIQNLFIYITYIYFLISNLVINFDSNDMNILPESSKICFWHKKYKPGIGIFLIPTALKLSSLKNIRNVPQRHVARLILFSFFFCYLQINAYICWLNKIQQCKNRATCRNYNLQYLCTNFKFYL